MEEEVEGREGEGAPLPGLAWPGEAVEGRPPPARVELGRHLPADLASRVTTVARPPSKELAGVVVTSMACSTHLTILEGEEAAGGSCSSLTLARARRCCSSHTGTTTVAVSSSTRITSCRCRSQLNIDSTVIAKLWNVRIDLKRPQKGS